jgi:hypothetical protein
MLLQPDINNQDARINKSIEDQTKAKFHEGVLPFLGFSVL